MSPTVRDISRGHAIFGSAQSIVRERRALYSLTADINADSDELRLDPEVLDNPSVRGHIGKVLGGHETFRADQCVSLAELVCPEFETEVAGCPIRLASTHRAVAELAGAIERVGDETARRGTLLSSDMLLTVASSERLEEAFQHIVKGARLAVEIVGEIALDLLPHIALFAVLDRAAAGRLGSASAREFPGLVVIPEPSSAFEVAEAIIHEGAHQKFFDLAVTRMMLGVPTSGSSTYAPPWAPSGAAAWPLVQAVAAWHAYSCLAAFADCATALRHPLDAGSLLPVAAERAAQIGDWLLGQGARLGIDGHHLIATLIGRTPRDPAYDAEFDLDHARDAAAAGLLAVRRCGSRAVIATRSSPPDLYWVHADVVTDLR